MDPVSGRASGMQVRMTQTIHLDRHASNNNNSQKNRAKLSLANSFSYNGAIIMVIPTLPWPSVKMEACVSVEKKSPDFKWLTFVVIQVWKSWNVTCSCCSCDRSQRRSVFVEYTKGWPTWFRCEPLTHVSNLTWRQGKKNMSIPLFLTLKRHFQSKWDTCRDLDLEWRTLRPKQSNYGAFLKRDLIISRQILKTHWSRQVKGHQVRRIIDNNNNKNNNVVPVQ